MPLLDTGQYQYNSSMDQLPVDPTPPLWEPNSGSKLCGCCRHLRFSTIFRGSETCIGCTIKDKESARSDGVIFGKKKVFIGSVRRVQESTVCPMCRLVASCIDSSGFTATPSLQVGLSLEQCTESFDFAPWPKDPTTRTSMGTVDPDQEIKSNPGAVSIDAEIEMKGQESVWHLGWVNVEVRHLTINEGDPLEVSGGASYLGRIIPTPTLDKMEFIHLRSPFSQSQFGIANVGKTISPQINLDVVRHWRDQCKKHHSEACIAPSVAIPKDARIKFIDIQGQRLIDADLTWSFVALSYVWGVQTRPVCTKSTVKRYSQHGGLNKTSVPQTIFDTMKLVADLGERYLWVDSVCIIQDDESNKLNQLPLMGSIYSNAVLVIVAAAGDNAHHGLPGKGYPRNVSQRREIVEDIELITGGPELDKTLRRSVWNQRGWTFQEAVLARRLLVITEFRAYWHCRSVSRCEDWPTETWLQPSGRPSATPKIFLGLHQGPTCGGANVLVPQVDGVCTDYYQYVREFMGRHFGNPRDVYWAFSGILESMKAEFPSGYIWALPQDFLDAALLWTPNCTHLRQCLHRFPWMSGAQTWAMEFPSWTWLSASCGASYKMQCWHSVESKVTWHEPLRYDDRTRLRPISGKCSHCGGYLKHKLTSVFLEDTKNPHVEMRPPWAPETSGAYRAKKLLVNRRHRYNLWRLIANNFLSIPYSRAALYALLRPLSETEFPDFGLLHFTAQSATLILRKGDSRCHNVKDPNSVSGTIHLLSGKMIGDIPLPERVLKSQEECEGEFILLSAFKGMRGKLICNDDTLAKSNGDTFHVPGCKHSPPYNIMLIFWEDHIAYRIALAKISKQDWEEANPRSKRVILG